jgi:hypothetical protein
MPICIYKGMGIRRVKEESRLAYIKFHHRGVNIPMKPVDSVFDFALSKKAL